MIELRHESADGAPAQALLAEYLELLRARLGSGFEPPADLFPGASDFSAFLVAYDGGDPVACGGLCSPEPGTGEIKRMFVAARARRRGHARRLLARLEAIAREAGQRRIVLHTTEALGEARTLYASAGYEPLAARGEGTRLDFWLEKRLAG